MKNKLFVISGASGVGKSTVLAQVMCVRPDLRFSVSATTRPPRENEVEGVSYYFVTKDKFLDMIEQKEFVEYDAHMENFYGTPRGQLEEKLQKGSVILDIEPNGAFNVRKERADAVLIFIAPPSLEELERRLRSRGDTSEEQIRVRQARVAWEMEQSKQYDYVVVNDAVERCAQEILEIIAREAE
ncbi:MAG: guanylate kinase [Oscillospiraceae bacterium]|nr:guanylate kinase [Oscillospiraceae bacterium]MBQ8880773.1 guanylate kinase [Oscillospiraceae bacterium]